MRITVRAVLRSSDMDAFSGMFNIRTFQMTDLAYPESRGKHKAENGLIFNVSDRKKKGLHFLSGWDKWDIGVKLPERKLERIP